tara:strand:+ start:1134 stop:1976 length:843 start_codon:yes stop_codon:yes gene_type:complete
MKQSVNIFVLNWNGKDFARDCIKSLNNITYLNANIILIDNGSTDHSAEKIKDEFPNVEIISTGQNLGYAAGNNYGFAHTKKESDFTIFINNDTVVNPDFIEPLINGFDNKGLVMQTSPKIFYDDNPNTIWFAGGKINLFFGFIRHTGIRKVDQGQFDTISKIDYATGCCFCIRTKDFKLLEMFNESYPMYAEDVDLSLRIRKMGGNIMYIPESKIWHKVSASIGREYSFNKWKRKNYSKIKLMMNYLNPILVPFAFILSIPGILFELSFWTLRKFMRKIK